MYNSTRQMLPIPNLIYVENCEKKQLLPLHVCNSVGLDIKIFFASNYMYIQVFILTNTLTCLLSLNFLFSDFESQTGHCVNCLLISYTVTTVFCSTGDFYILLF